MTGRARHRPWAAPSDLCFLTSFQGFAITRELQSIGLHPFHFDEADLPVALDRPGTAPLPWSIRMNYHRFDSIIVGAGGAGLMAALESSKRVGTAVVS